MGPERSQGGKKVRNSPMNTKAGEEGGEEVLQALDQRFSWNPWKGQHYRAGIRTAVFRWKICTAAFVYFQFLPKVWQSEEIISNWLTLWHSHLSIKLTFLSVWSTFLNLGGPSGFEKRKQYGFFILHTSTLIILFKTESSFSFTVRKERKRKSFKGSICKKK